MTITLGGKKENITMSLQETDFTNQPLIILNSESALHIYVNWA